MVIRARSRSAASVGVLRRRLFKTRRAFVHHQIRIDEAHRAFADGVFTALLARIAALHDGALLRRKAAPWLGLRAGGGRAGERRGRQGGRYDHAKSHLVISSSGPPTPV